MMAKLGKKADAIGFAIYLKELERLPEKSIRYDVDAWYSMSRMSM